MTTYSVTDAALANLADALLIPPFPGYSPPRWVIDALGAGLGGVTVFGPNIGSQAQLAGLIADRKSVV